MLRHAALAAMGEDLAMRHLVFLFVFVVGLAGLIMGCKQDLPGNLGPGQPVALRGAISLGTECPTLVVENDRTFSLTGDLGRFKPGDRVCVHGTVAEVSFCMAGEATIAVTSIAPEDSCP